jgi:hypothetical protein
MPISENSTIWFVLRLIAGIGYHDALLIGAAVVSLAALAAAVLRLRFPTLRPPPEATDEDWTFIQGCRPGSAFIAFTAA